MSQVELSWQPPTHPPAINPRNLLRTILAGAPLPTPTNHVLAVAQSNSQIEIDRAFPPSLVRAFVANEQAAGALSSAILSVAQRQAGALAAVTEAAAPEPGVSE